MPFTPEMRQGIDQIRNYLYGGGYPDPVGNPVAPARRDAA